MAADDREGVGHAPPTRAGAKETNSHYGEVPSLGGITTITDGRQRRLPPGVLLRWLRAYAEATATDTKFSTISEHAKRQDGDVAANTTIAFYREVLEGLGVIDSMDAWEPPLSPISNCKTGKRHHLVDPAFSAHMLGLTEPDQLVGNTTLGIGAGNRNRTIFGALFESLVAQSVRIYAGAQRASTFWLGTLKKGRGPQREVDLVVVARNRKVVGIEVKLSERVSDSDVEHLRWLRDQLGTRWRDGIVINTGTEAYRRDDGIAVVPAALLGP